MNQMIPHNSINRRSLQGLITIVLLFVLSQNIVAQEIGFLPEGVSGVSYEYQADSANQGFNGGGVKVDLKQILADRFKADRTEIDGKISLESSAHVVDYQYGFSESFNLGLTLKYVTEKRNSTLSATGSASANSQTLVNAYQSAETSGLGDYEIWSIYRMVYNDSHDFRIGLAYVGKNAPYYYNDPDKVSLGSGTRELLLDIHWLFYPQNIAMTLEFKYTNIFTFSDSVNGSDGKSYSIKRGNSSILSATTTFNANAVYWGLGFTGSSLGNTIIGNQSTGGVITSYELELFLGYGNLHRLETEELTFPWSVQFTVGNVVKGINAEADVGYGIKAYFYF